MVSASGTSLSQPRICWITCSKAKFFEERGQIKIFGNMTTNRIDSIENFWKYRIIPTVKKMGSLLNIETGELVRENESRKSLLKLFPIAEKPETEATKHTYGSEFLPYKIPVDYGFENLVQMTEEEESKGGQIEIKGLQGPGIALISITRDYVDDFTTAIRLPGLCITTVKKAKKKYRSDESKAIGETVNASPALTSSYEIRIVFNRYENPSSSYATDNLINMFDMIDMVIKERFEEGWNFKLKLFNQENLYDYTVKSQELRKLLKDNPNGYEMSSNLIRKNVLSDEYEVYCPMCHYWFEGSPYLLTVFDDDKVLWMANMVTHYRHGHITWWNKCWGYHGGYYRGDWFGDYEYEKKKVNESSKRQIIRKCAEFMKENGVLPEHIAALQNTTQETMDVAEEFLLGIKKPKKKKEKKEEEIKEDGSNQELVGKQLRDSSEHHESA